MSEWKTGQLKDFIEINPPTKLTKGKVYPFVSMEAVEPHHKPVTAQELREFKSGGSKFENGDTLFARITPCLENGKTSQVKQLKDGRGFGSTEFIILRGIKDITDNDYVYYMSIDKDLRGKAKQLMVGTSGRQRVDKEQFMNLKIEIPPIKIQQEISRILKALDDKIELSRKMNKTLEEMATTLYKHWFVNFGPFQDGEFVDSELGRIPKGWRVKQLSELIDVKHGYAFKSKYFSNEGKLIVLTPGNFRSNGGLKSKGQKEKYYNEKEPDGYLLEKGELLVVMTDLTSSAPILGSPAFINKDHKYLHNQRLGKVQVINGNSTSKYFIYHLLNSSNVREIIKAGASGTTVRHTSPKRIKEIKVIDAPIHIQESFEKLVEKYHEIIMQNYDEIESLAQTRDYLLPRLISGEIDLSEAKEHVEEALT